MYKFSGILAVGLLIMCTAYSQYTVTKVIGQVKNKSTGERLKPGSKLKDDDMIEWSSDNDVVRVIVSGKGIFVISPTPKSSNGPNALVEMLKSTLKIKSREGYLSGRGHEESDLLPEVWETESAVNNRVLVTTESRYLFDPTKYNLSNGSRFFVQLEIAGGSPEIHALTTVADTLLLKTKDFEARQQTDAKINYKIGFFSKDSNTSEPIATIVPYFDSTGEMETIIDVVISEYKSLPVDSLKRACYAEVYESLGKPSKIDFEEVFMKKQKHK